MNKQETKQAEKLLKDRVDRTVKGWVAGRGDNDTTLTAYWLDGGQKLFYTLREVRGWLAER